MTTPTTFRSFPAHKVASATEALTKAHARLVRAATKAGQTAPSAPTLTVTREYVVSSCTECGAYEEGYAGGTCLNCKKGIVLPRAKVDLELTFDRPVLAGWEFAAVVEPLEGGNLIKSVPGFTGELDTTPFRTGAIRCDHCETIRRRTETFIVVADGSDSAVALGTVKQVGRNCLKAFFGGKTPAAILASFEYEKLVSGEGEEGCGGGGSGPRVYSPIELLSWTVASIRECGWLGRGVARDTGKQATADHVLYLLNPPFGGGREVWHKAVTLCTPTKEEGEKAALVLEYAKNLTGTSDYERNLALVASQSVVRDAHVGIFCSAVSSYERSVSANLKRREFASSAALSTHVGAVGDKIVTKVTVQGVFDVETQFGILHINKFRDEAGNTLVWKTGSYRGDVGKTLTLKGTVKAHTEYKNEKQTELSRCKEV